MALCLTLFTLAVFGWMHRRQPRLAAALGKKRALPKRKVRGLEAFAEAFPDVERVILDGTERPIQRAKNRGQQGVGEHAFAGLKRYGIASQVYRNRKPDFDDRLMVTASGL